MTDKICNLIGMLKVWNKEKFGNIFHTKRRLLARILGIQLCISNSPSFFLSNLEETLLNEYRAIIEQEEIF